MDSYIATLTGLLATEQAPGKISDHLLFESLDVDYEEEKKRMRKEAIDRAVQTQELQALSKMTLEELQTIDADKPIVDTHKGEPMPMSPEQMAMPGGMPGGPGGKPPGLPKGGLPGGAPRPPKMPGGPGGKPPGGPPGGGPLPGGGPPPAGGEAPPSPKPPAP